MLKITKSILLLGMLIAIPGYVNSQIDWREITSVEDLYESYPETMKNMFEDFDLDHRGLEKVKAAYNNGDMVDACNHLLDYYRNGNMAPELRRDQPAKTDETEALADTILKYV